MKYHLRWRMFVAGMVLSSTADDPDDYSVVLAAMRMLRMRDAQEGLVTEYWMEPAA